MRHLAYERAKGWIFGNKRGNRLPVVPQLVRIVSIISLVTLQVVQVDSTKIGLVLLEMVHAFSNVGWNVCLVEFIPFQFIIAFVVGVVVVTEHWMKNRVFHIKVRFCNGKISFLRKEIIIMVILKITWEVIAPG